MARLVLVYGVRRTVMIPPETSVPVCVAAPEEFIGSSLSQPASSPHANHEALLLPQSATTGAHLAHSIAYQWQVVAPRLP